MPVNYSLFNWAAPVYNPFSQHNMQMGAYERQRQERERAAAQQKQAAARAAAQKKHEAEMAAINARIAQNEKELNAMRVARENDALRREQLRKQSLSEQDVLGGEDSWAQILVPILG